MLLHVQRELRFGETVWLRAEPAVSLVIAHARGKGAEYGSSPAHACAHALRYICLPSAVPPQVCSRVGAVGQADALRPRLLYCRAPIWHQEMGLAYPLSLGLRFILDAPCTTQDNLLIELGVVFCLSCHKRLILWRVLEGSEIHLE